MWTVWGMSVRLAMLIRHVVQRLRLRAYPSTKKSFELLENPADELEFQVEKFAT